jgi:hypothetical protein
MVLNDGSRAVRRSEGQRIIVRVLNSLVMHFLSRVKAKIVSVILLRPIPTCATGEGVQNV